MKKYLELNKNKMGLKLSLIGAMILLYAYLFIDKLYLVDGKVSIGRIIFPFILLILFAFGLFFKPKVKLSNRTNFIISLVVSFLFIIFNFVILQYAQSLTFELMKWQFMVINIGLLGVIFIVLFAIFNSFKKSIIVLNSITLFFAIVEYYVVEFRGLGFLAIDIQNIKTAANVAGAYSYSLNYEVYITLFIMITLIPFILYLGTNTFFKGKKRLIPVVFAIITLIGFILCIHTDYIDKRLKIKYYRPQDTFEKKGLPISFVKSIKDLVIAKPDGYSIENVDNILKEYKSDSKKDVKSPNIIVIMDEAYTDFSEIVDLKISEDYVPFIHSLDDNTIKGQLFTSIFGGGTSATEFEALTSNSMAFIPYGTNAYRAYIHTDFPNLTTTLGDLGYSGLLAMHPFKPTGYSRDKVYPLLGFKDFITMEDFDSDVLTYNRYISDSTDFKRIISEYEKAKKDSDAPFYFFNVTMQNHSPFACRGVKQTIKLKYKDEYPKANCYVNMVKHTDDAVKELVTYFEKQDEDTVIVFFGDHEPRVEEEFYYEVLKTYKNGKEYTNFQKYSTQYFIWANYDIKERKDYKISANYISNLLLEVTGLPKTGYDKYVSSIRSEVPIITDKGYMTKDGKFYAFDNKKSKYYKLVYNYRLVEYNSLFDYKNRLNSYFYLK